MSLTFCNGERYWLKKEMHSMKNQIKAKSKDIDNMIKIQKQESDARFKDLDRSIVKVEEGLEFISKGVRCL